MERYVVRSLLAITVLAWGALIVEGVADTLNAKGFAILCCVAAIAPILAAIRVHSEQVRRTMVSSTRTHSERMERALESHAALLARQESLVEKLTECIFRGMTRAQIDVALMESDTGPFPVFNQRG